MNMNRDVKKEGTMASSSCKPLVVPEDEFEFLFLEKERTREEHRKQRILKVHEKGLNPRKGMDVILSRYVKEIEKENVKEQKERIQVDGTYVAPRETQSTFTRDYYHIGTVRDFAEKEKEICRHKYSISVGRDVIHSLEKQTASEVAELEKAESHFTNEAFDKYVKEQETRTLLAMKRAEEESKVLQATEEEVQRIDYEVGRLKKAVTKQLELLKDSEMCKEFLWKLSSPEWQEQQEVRRQKAEKIKAAAEEKELSRQASQSSGFSAELPLAEQGSNIKESIESSSKEDMLEPEQGIVAHLELYEMPQIYFKDPMQLMNMMAKTEQQIKSLIKELDGIGKSLEFYTPCEREERSKLEQEIAVFNELAENLTKCINEKHAKAAELDEEIDRMNTSENSLEKQEAELEQFYKKIKEVYDVCMGGPQDILPSSELLEPIEKYVVDLMEMLSNLPAMQLRSIKTEYRKVKIARVKKEEEERKKKVAEERWQQRAALKQQWAQTKVKRPMAKKVMWRSYMEKKEKKVERKKEDNKGFYDL